MAENKDCKKANVKLGARYVVLAFFMYLAWLIVSPEWINNVKGIDAMTLNVIVGAVFGALTLILKSHFETKVED
jgi:multisubunit Na+/H+ antiporter MnhF subunit